MPVYPNPHNPAQPPGPVPSRSNTLIYAYEARFARWLQGCFPEIELATYAPDFSMFESLSPVVYYPAFYYCRESSDWSYNKIYKVYDEEQNKNILFCPFLQSYTGRLFFKTQAEVFDAARKLRFFWNPNCYINVPWSDDESVNVNLRLLALSERSLREVNDNKGASRYLEFKWRSQLFMQNTPAEQAILTESINIHLFANETVVTLDGQEEPILTITV